jgi:hypothetical protein
VQVESTFQEHFKGATKVNVGPSNKTTPHKHILSEADAMIILLPDLRFQAEFNDLPIDMRSDLISAVDLNKAIYVGYMPKSGNIIRFYDTEFTNKYKDTKCTKISKSTQILGTSIIRGLIGTADALFYRDSNYSNGNFDITNIPNDDLYVHTKDHQHLNRVTGNLIMPKKDMLDKRLLL